MNAHQESGTKYSVVLLFLLGVVLLSAHVTLAADDRPTRVLVDETGRVVRVPARIERIITLVPSLTEIVYALGLEDRLVGVTISATTPRRRSKSRAWAMSSTPTWK